MFGFTNPEYKVQGKKSRFRHQLNILIWKSYIQRQQRWRILLAETIFALLLFILALWSSSHVFLKLLQEEPARPRTPAQIMAAMPNNTILGYAPEDERFKEVMEKAAKTLKMNVVNAPTTAELNILLYKAYQGSLARSPVIWVIFEPMQGNVWKFSLQSNERTKYLTNDSERDSPLLHNPHLLSGFLAVQVAVSEAIVEISSTKKVNYQILLAAMPVSPLMKEQNVRDAVSLLLACFTLALLPPVMETEALVVKETCSGFKRALRIYEVDYATMYLAWLSFAGMTITPICILASITLILIFRWIHVFVAMLLIMAYTYVMMLMSLIMAMFHERVSIAWAWTALFTITQTMLAELLINHRYDQVNEVLTAILNTVIPPMGLIHGLNQFAMMQAGEGNQTGLTGSKVAKMLLTWIVMIIIYFLILMLFQRVHGQAIGGNVHWKSIIFKKKRDKNKLFYVHKRNKTDDIEQKVDELVPKAISFKNVSKNILNDNYLSNVWMDIYRNEFSLLFTQRYQSRMINLVEDLILGLNTPDNGTITILGNDLEDGYKPMTELYGMGYCHQPDFLIDELTVQDMLSLLIELCLWRQSNRFIWEYNYLRSKYLLKECQLKKMRYERIGDLGVYYKTLLCWAIALLLEPRIIIVSQVLENPKSVAVITDKIMLYKKYVAILHFSDSYQKLEYADRVFLFDHRILIFGGTPAYMFYKYGRDYRIRLTFVHGCNEDKKLKAIAKIYQTEGAQIRCYFGSLLIMKMPISPPENVAQFMQHLYDNREAYAIKVINISVPDPDEVYKRAIHESKESDRTIERIDLSKSNEEMHTLPVWHRKKSELKQVQVIGLKFFSFYRNNKRVLFVTVLSAIVTGVCFSLNMSKPLLELDDELRRNVTQGRELLTVEARSFPTNLIMRIANETECLAIANAYVLSATSAKKSDVDKLTYTCVASNKSLSEYLITRVIDSPQVYVHRYAYGVNIRKNPNGKFRIKILYSPFHVDRAAAVRSTGRAYMALLRYYSGNMDANIEVIDHPIGIDYVEWVAFNTPPPLLVHFLLVFTIAHVIIIPSKENGFIKYNQMHASGFSPFKYWVYLLMYDVMLYGVLVLVVTASMVSLFYAMVPQHFADIRELSVITILLLIYGMTCIPQAYLFTLFGQRSTLNSVIYVIVNIVFGEATIVFKYFYGGLSQINFMVLSPQYNMAYALLKVKLIFFSNNECRIINANSWCVNGTLHKCCEHCGVLQSCHKQQKYFEIENGIVKEIGTIIFGALFFFSLLMFIDHKLFRSIIFYVKSKMRQKIKKTPTIDAPTDEKKRGADEEETRVNEKLKQIAQKKGKENEFGAYLLADHVTSKKDDVYELRQVCLGLGSGDALALTGRVHHGRQALCNVLAGYKRPTRGNVISMAKYKLMTSQHRFCRHVSYSCSRSPLPPWMSVQAALRMLAVLRGVPSDHLHLELTTLLSLMDMKDERRTLVGNISKRVEARLHVLAAVLGAPPVIVLDEAMAFQRFYVKRAAFSILNELKMRGHAIVVSSPDVESQMPVTNRMAIMLDGYIFDVGNMTMLKERYGMKGYTVVVHVKDEVDVVELFKKYFAHFVINDVSGVLINCQVLDVELTVASVFERMERLRLENIQVYSYIVSMIPLANLYNKIIKNEVGYMNVYQEGRTNVKTKLHLKRQKMVPAVSELKRLRKLEPKFYTTSLKELPWSVIFKR